MTRKAKATRKDAAPARAVGRPRDDGWTSALTGMGTISRDKRQSNAFQLMRLTRVQAEQIWRGDDMAGRIVETRPKEMLRQGYEVKIAAEEEPDELPDDEGDFPPEARGDAFPPFGGGGPTAPEKPPGVIQQSDSGAREQAEAISAKLVELGVDARMQEALMYKAAYGGGAILLGVDDGVTDLRLPLREESIKTFAWVNVLERDELYPVQWYADPFQPKYGHPEIFQILPRIAASGAVPGRDAGKSLPVTGSVYVHESRLVRFTGLITSKQQAIETQGWGDGDLQRCHAVLRDFNLGWDGAGVLLSDFAQAVFKMKGLADLIATDQDDVVANRMRAVDMSRSVARAILIDADQEEFERKQTPLTGLPEMLEKFMLRLAAAARMPVSLLMGQAPAGLNATGDSDIRWFYDDVKGDQDKILEPALRRVIRLVMLAKDGPTGGVEPDNWSVHFRPLWQQSDSEKADTRLKTSQADVAYITAGVVTPEEVAASRFGGDEWSMETVIDFEGRQQMADKFETDQAQFEKDKAESDKVKAKALAEAAAKAPAQPFPPKGPPAPKE